MASSIIIKEEDKSKISIEEDKSFLDKLKSS